MRIVIILLFVLFISCNTSHSSPLTDYDIDLDSQLSTDRDSDLSTHHDSDATTDHDSPLTDSDSDIVCLDLRISENVIKTPFPFKDKNSKPTFCRPGCDTPTETDPQCVRNIWDWDNWKVYQAYLAAQKRDPEQTGERECYPWPCKMPDMDGKTDVSTSSCDKFLTAYGFSSSSGTIWSHGMSGGVAGMFFGHGSTGRAMEYNPEKDAFTTVGQSMGQMAFDHGRYISLVFDRFPSDDRDQRAFVISIERKDGKYYYELIYDAKEHQASFSRPPMSGKEWVLLHVCEGEDGLCEVKYAKAGVWEWHSLGVGAVYEGNIVGNHLTMMVPYTNPDRQVYYCDLSKYPTNYKECLKITRNIDGVQELGNSPRIDEDNEKRLVYHIWKSDPPTLVEVFFNGSTPVYKNYDVPHFMQPSKLKSEYMMYTSSPTSTTELFGCWYRFDTQKTYCPTKQWLPSTDMMFSTFSGKWQLWKTPVSSFVRDWECYCKEEGICPFEGSEPPKMDD